MDKPELVNKLAPISRVDVQPIRTNPPLAVIVGPGGPLSRQYRADRSFKPLRPIGGQCVRRRIVDRQSPHFETPQKSYREACDCKLVRIQKG